MFPIITNKKQKSFEKIYENTERAEKVPCICGYCGRGCRQMNKNEGANTMICTSCPLAQFVEENDYLDQLYEEFIELGKRLDSHYNGDDFWDI